MACMRNWLLLVSKAAAYFGFIVNARHKVFRMNSKEDSVSPGYLSQFIVNMSTPSFTTSINRSTNMESTLLLVGLVASPCVTYFLTINEREHWGANGLCPHQVEIYLLPRYLIDEPFNSHKYRHYCVQVASYNERLVVIFNGDAHFLYHILKSKTYVQFLADEVPVEQLGLWGELRFEWLQFRYVKAYVLVTISLWRRLILKEQEYQYFLQNDEVFA